MRPAAVIGIVVGFAGTAAADEPPNEPIERRRAESGYLGKDIPKLEIENCPPLPEGMTEAEREKLGEERYFRGETLYIQGDYPGAISEFVGSYCLVGYYTILKDIGQAFERDLQYEKAVAYLEHYVTAIKPEYKRAAACAPDPQADKENVARRIEVLSKLRAHVSVQTNPPDATITLQNNAGVAARAASGSLIEVPGATYDMVIEHAGYVTKHVPITVQIGQPYTYFFTLEPQRGQLSVTVTPADARIFIDNRFAGIGRVEEPVKSDTYKLLVEAPGREPVERRIEVLAGEINRVQVDVPPAPQFGRRQLIVASAFGGSIATGELLAAFSEGEVQFAGFVGGAAAGLIGSYVLLPERVPLGTSNLTITSSLIGAIGGLTGSLLFTGNDNVVQPLTGAGIVVGATAGYLIGERTKIGTGDAAIINTGATWGTAAGLAFSISFDAPRNIGAGLVLSGLGIGTIGGALLSSYFDISRTHAALIDLGGVLGVIGGLAAVGIIYPETDASDRRQEHQANFALGGMTVGLLGAAILTRNLDAPKVPVTPTLGAATDASGASTTTLGLMGQW